MKHERLRTVREEAADAYADGLNAAIWFQSTRVEDSVLPDIDGGSVVNGYEAARPGLLSAHRVLNRVSALSTDEALGSAASRAALLLGELDDAWQWGRSWANDRHHRSQPLDKDGKMILKACAQIDERREDLLGYADGPGRDDSRLEVGGALGELRTAISGCLAD